MSQSQPKQMNFGRGPRVAGPAEKAKNQKETISRVWHYVKQQKIGLLLGILKGRCIIDYENLLL